MEKHAGGYRAAALLSGGGGVEEKKDTEKPEKGKRRIFNNHNAHRFHGGTRILFNLLEVCNSPKVS
jgi:hypothetical protein